MLRRLTLVVLVGLCAAQQQRPAVADAVPAAEPSEAEPSEAEPPLSEAAAPPTATKPGEPSWQSVPKRRLRLGVALRATRPWSFPATVSPVLFGSALAFQVEDRFGPAQPSPAPASAPAPALPPRPLRHAMPHTPTTLLLHHLQVEDRFGPLKLLLTLGTTLAVHAAGNLMNTLFDYRNGYDGAGS